MRSLFLCSLALTLAACHAAPAPLAVRAASTVRAAAADDLYPVEAGRTWTYALDQQQGDDPVQHRAMTIRITSSREISPGLTEAVLDRDYGGFKPPSTRVRKDASHVSLSRLTDPVDGPSITILNLPLTVGASWPGRDFGGGNTETIFPQGPESVTVPAGTFAAQRVDHHIHYAQGTEDVLSYWYAPGTGMVKMIERLTVWQGSAAVHMISTGSLSAGVTTSCSAAGLSCTGRPAWGFLVAPDAALSGAGRPAPTSAPAR